MAQEANVRVCARFRPLNRIEETSRVCVSVPAGSRDTCELTTDSDTHPFTFSRVFSMSAPQSEVYADVGAPIVHDVMLGYNGTIFVYGQTGSGKTYTMMGAPQDPVGSSLNVSSLSAFANNNSINSSRNNFSPPMFCLDGAYSGIIPRAVDDLFNRINSADAELEFEIKLFFVEIYMEHVRDLLDPTRVNLNVREETASSSFYVEGCVTPYVSSAQEVLEYVEAGLRNRTTAATRMNDVSSRSHCLLGLTVKSVHMLRGEVKVGKLFMVDLAGTEKVAKTKAEGVQLEEAKLINKSLTTLGLVIKNLTDAKALHIPYRDSKLTKILQDALGGNSRTTLVVCCSPAFANWQETQSTLRFGARAKDIRNRAVVNKEYSVTELKNMLALAQAEIHRLRSGGTPTVAPATPSSEMALLQLEARREESERHLKAQIATLEEELRASQVTGAAARDTAARHAILVRSLEDEVTAWEQEYKAARVDVFKARQDCRTLARALASERTARHDMRTTVNALLEELLQVRNQITDIRAECSASARTQLVTDIIANHGAALTPTNAMHVDPEMLALRGLSDDSPDRGALSPSPVVVLNSLETTAMGPATGGGQILVPSSRSSSASIREPLELLSEQLTLAQCELRSLRGERRQTEDQLASLRLQLEVATENLDLRSTRIQTLRVKLDGTTTANFELKNELSRANREILVLKSEVRQARLDVQHSDAMAHRLAGARVVKHVRGGRDGTSR